MVMFPEPMAESICSTSSCPGLRRWPRNLLRTKEKNLRCKFGKIETSNVGNVNQEGNQEDIGGYWRSATGAQQLESTTTLSHWHVRYKNP